MFFLRSDEMKMVVIHEVKNVEKWLENKKDCHRTISKFAENIVESIIDYVS